ncbi:MAG: 4'-phosphopantetheinyl transferase superfamily protein [Salinibacterium sp.]|nr:4'-phosphopantetheinyl transferase superfamily protein [Salinibacterium sp.]
MHSTRAGTTMEHPGVLIGCDIHPVFNVVESLDIFGDRYLARVFTPAEQAACEGVAFAERLAARYAAKESILKLLKVPAEVAVPWTDIEIGAETSGAPTVSLTGRAAEIAATLGVSVIELTLSHDAGLAMAVAAAVVGVKVEALAA